MPEKSSTKKNYAVVNVVSNLTEAQASKLVGEYAKAKNKIAPKARGTGAMTTRENIGQLLQNEIKKITGNK